ncbi:MAG: TlpA disulfide reductase family protein [Flavobacteriales bacterium]|nr:TlpA disulfide reductase family protein [Flavobacteriales bacterium]
MKTTTASLISCIALFGVLFTSCNSGEPKPSATTPAVASDSTAIAGPIAFTNGINDANRGDKRGPIKLVVQLKYLNPYGIMVLYETEGKFRYPLDSVSVEKGVCIFPEREYSRGVYMLALSGTEENTHPILLNPDEAEVTVGFNSPKFEGALFSVQSKENQGLAKYHIQEAIFDHKILDLKKKRSKTEIKSEYDMPISDEEKKLQELRGQIIQEYPGTFLAKLLTWKQEPYKSDKKKFWDHLDFTDESLLRTRVIHEHSQTFFQHFGEATEEGLISCIDIIVEKAKGNEKILESTLYSMLDGFSQTKYEGICRYLLDNYIFGDGCGAELSQTLKARSQGIRNSQVGQVPPNIKMPLLGGGTSDLYSLVSKNKFTLVMFWSSWCQHCSEDAVNIKAVYDLYHKKGFEILGVSVDKDRGMWTKAVSDRKFNFPHVCGFEQWDSKVAKDYFVVRTPVFILLDSNKTIVFKTTKGMADVKTYLDAHLK